MSFHPGDFNANIDHQPTSSSHKLHKTIQPRKKNPLTSSSSSCPYTSSLSSLMVPWKGWQIAPCAIRLLVQTDTSGSLTACPPAALLTHRLNSWGMRTHVSISSPKTASISVCTPRVSGDDRASDEGCGKTRACSVDLVTAALPGVALS